MLEFEIDAFNLARQPMADGVRSHWLGRPLLVALLAAGPAQAQIVTDGSVGPKVSLSGGEIKIGADLGTQRGDNLFHSFEKFGIATGQTATFTGPGAIKNVISRVTGGEISNIDGTLASKVGQADLYFLNPAGVMFGPNAKLEVPGSFHVSTTHELRFANGVRFSALDKAGSGLTVASPEAFGFLTEAPKPIQVDRSELRVTRGKVLSLVGGDLMIDSGQTGSIGTDDGVVHLVSAAAPGAVRIADATTTVGQRGAVRITQSGNRPGIGVLGAVDVSGQNGGGTIRIRGGRITLDGAWVFADNYGSQDSTGGIDVQTDSLVMRGGYLTTDVLGAGRGGTITIETKDFQLHDGATMRSDSHPDGIGSSGRITIKTDHLLLVGGNEDTQITTNTHTIGNAGDIAITAKILELQPGGWIRSEALRRPSGPSGRSGAITIQTDNLLVSGTTSRAAGITTRTNSIGQGGRIVITAKEREGQIVLHGGVLIDSGTSGSGDGGDVIIEVNRLKASSDSAEAQVLISSTTRGGGGPAGKVILKVSELVLRGNVQISTTTGGSGAAGTVTIQARSMSLTNGAQVWAGSLGPNVTGVGGSIMIEAADALSLDHAAVEARTTTAEGGDVTLRVGRLFDLNNSTLTTSVAEGEGSGGNILINSPLMVFDNSKIIANAIGGSGGNITIQAGQLIRAPNNVITASGKVAGNIAITAPNTDVAGSLVVLPGTFFDASSQLREACAARGSRPSSSFNAGGRGGLPPAPGTPLAASPFGQPLEQQTATRSPTPSSRPPQVVKPITVAGIPQPVLGFPRLTCRE